MASPELKQYPVCQLASDLYIFQLVALTLIVATVTAFSLATIPGFFEKVATQQRLRALHAACGFLPIALLLAAFFCGSAFKLQGIEALTHQFATMSGFKKPAAFAFAAGCVGTLLPARLAFAHRILLLIYVPTSGLVALAILAFS